MSAYSFFSSSSFFFLSASSLAFSSASSFSFYFLSSSSSFSFFFFSANSFFSSSLRSASSFSFYFFSSSFFSASAFSSSSFLAFYTSNIDCIFCLVLDPFFIFFSNACLARFDPTWSSATSVSVFSKSIFFLSLDSCWITSSTSSNFFALGDLSFLLPDFVSPFSSSFSSYSIISASKPCDS